MHHLPRGMHTGISTPGTDYLHRLIGHNRQGFFQAFLYCAGAMLLHLPA